MVKINLKNRIIIIVGIIFIVLGIFINIIYKFESYIKEEKERQKVINYIESTKGNTVIPTISKIESSRANISNKTTNYKLILEIPKIKLKKGLYDIDNYMNDVKYNIQIIKESNMPDIDKGVLILAGHNGNSKISYFNKIDKLDVNDEIIIYYNGIKYKYIVDNSYIIKKDGNVEIKRDKDKTTLVLTTCISNTNKQLVYISYLDSREGY